MNLVKDTLDQPLRRAKGRMQLRKSIDEKRCLILTPTYTSTGVTAQIANGYPQYDITTFPAGSHVRVHPLLDWTELKIWEYLDLEQIPLPKVYFDQGTGVGYRGLGCVLCTVTVSSCASTIPRSFLSFASPPSRNDPVAPKKKGADGDASKARAYVALSSVFPLAPPQPFGLRAGCQCRR